MPYNPDHSHAHQEEAIGWKIYEIWQATRIRWEVARLAGDVLSQWDRDIDAITTIEVRLWNEWWEAWKEEFARRDAEAAKQGRYGSSLTRAAGISR